MFGNFIPPDPEKVMVIRDLLPNITNLSMPFVRGNLFKLGVRATIVKLASGSLAVFSPVPLTPSVQSKLESLGNKVAYVTALNIEHHLWLGQWYDAYPKAHIIGPEGLLEKRAKDKSQARVPIHTIVTSQNQSLTRVSKEFSDEFEVEFADAHVNKELVFLHKPSKTLIEADFMMNLPSIEQFSRSNIDPRSGFWGKAGCYLESAQGEAIGQRRLLWWALASQDRPRFAQSVRRVDSWDFENVAVCHGEVILGQGKEMYRNVFRWFLDMEINKEK